MSEEAILEAHDRFAARSNRINSWAFYYVLFVALIIFGRMGNDLFVRTIDYGFLAIGAVTLLLTIRILLKKTKRQLYQEIQQIRSAELI